MSSSAKGTNPVGTSTFYDRQGGISLFRGLQGTPAGVLSSKCPFTPLQLQSLILPSELRGSLCLPSNLQMDVANFTNALTPMTRVSHLPNVFISILTNPFV